MLDIRDNIREVLSFVDRVSDQYPFAVASALTGTMRQVRDAMPAEADKAFEGVTPFTRSAFYFQGASKARLVASVGVKDKQARYLVYQIQGGSRYPTRKALKLPGAIRLDERGNIPPTELRRVIAAAKKARVGARNLRAAGKNSYMGESRGMFYGKPANRPDLPPGVYRRVEVKGKGGARFLQPLVLFPAMPAKYERRFDFYGIARTLTLRDFDRNLAESFRRAKATAR